MRKKSNIAIIGILTFQLLVASCVCEEPLELFKEKHVLNTKITEFLPDSLMSFENLKMRTASMVFYPASGGSPVTETIGSDDGQVSLSQGRYSLLIYTSDFFELDAVFYRGMESPETAEAYTRQSVDGENSIAQEPDPLFSSYTEDFSINEQSDSISVALIPRVYTYRFKISVEGIQYLQSAMAKVTGFYTSAYLKDGRHRESESAAVLVKLKKETVNTSEGYIYGEFRSFGAHQGGDVKHRISVALNNGGTKVVELDDLTKSIKALPRGGEIVIEQKIVIKNNGGSEGGGDFNPGILDWEYTVIPLPA